MRTVVLLCVLAALPAAASGVTVCTKWEEVDAGLVEADGGPTKKSAEDAGTIYATPTRRCVQWAVAGEPTGCNASPTAFAALAVLWVIRSRRWAR
ncbi:MAG: hypothetical protein U0228_24310 [Myxococcaceae bacterium]